MVIFLIKKLLFSTELAWDKITNIVKLLFHCIKTCGKSKLNISKFGSEQKH